MSDVAGAARIAALLVLVKSNEVVPKATCCFQVAVEGSDEEGVSVPQAQMRLGFMLLPTC